MYFRFLKRLFDLLIMLLALPIILPVLLVVALLAALAYRANPFFTQLRIGQHGQPFRILKLRTMSSQRDANGVLLPDEQRITKLGRWLRTTSLDELPQCWNILRGDMSVVGPRPLLPDYWPLYTPQQRQRHLLRPGLTGWAQINGRNAISWEAKFALDNWYLNHVSFTLDVQIMWKTARLLLTRQGALPNNHTLMPRFTGSTMQHD